MSSMTKNYYGTILKISNSLLPPRIIFNVSDALSAISYTVDMQGAAYNRFAFTINPHVKVYK